MAARRSRHQRHRHAGMDTHKHRWHASGTTTPESLESSGTSIDSSSSEDSDFDTGNGTGTPGDSGAEASFLGFPNSTLAALLSPSRELCDQPFELVVDHLAFVGHPVWLGDEDQPSGRRQDVAEGDEGEDENNEDADARGRRRQRHAHAPANSSSLAVQVDDPKLPRQESSSGSRSSLSRSRSSSRGASPMSRTTLSRSMSSTNTLQPLASITSSQQSHGSIHGSGRLSSFNFVCVIDTPPDSHLSSHLEGYYKDVVVPITANLKALEKKERWLGKEAAKLRKAQEKLRTRALDALEQVEALSSLSDLVLALTQLFAALKSRRLANVAFGSLPIQVLLRGEVAVEDEVDALERERIESALQADTGKDHGDDITRPLSPSREPYHRQRAPPLFSKMRRRPPVRFQPWQTLLPLEDTDELQKSVEEGSLLWRFLDICSPTLSFAEYETLLDLDSDERPMKDVVEHLVHWNKARVVDVVSLKNPYAIRQDFQMSTLPDRTRAFAAAFPVLPPLPIVLCRVNPREPFGNMSLSTPSLRTSYFQALVWLLQTNVLEKQRFHVRVVVSEEVKRAAMLKWSHSNPRGHRDDGASTSDGAPRSSSDRSYGERSRTNSRVDLDDTKNMVIVGSALSGSPPAHLSRSQQSSSRLLHAGTRRNKTQSDLTRAFSGTTLSSQSSQRPDESEKGTSVIVEPGRPTALERKWIDEICRDKDKHVVQKFEKVVRMFNGAHHLDEIRHRAELSRRDIRIVLSAFESHLILFQHP
ncbi:Nitrogen permease regulator 3 [Microbotryomycetes sp. JL221]|nr:Nitrogen permease regulator 3 [Microbotryomycetes sp. JL221]